MTEPMCCLIKGVLVCVNFVSSIQALLMYCLCFAKHYHTNTDQYMDHQNHQKFLRDDVKKTDPQDSWNPSKIILLSLMSYNQWNLHSHCLLALNQNLVSNPSQVLGHRLVLRVAILPFESRLGETFLRARSLVNPKPPTCKAKQHR